MIPPPNKEIKITYLNIEDITLERLFYSLKQQLLFDTMLVCNVRTTYRDVQKDLNIIDFDYKGGRFKLILNGNIFLESPVGQFEIRSYQDLVRGLIQSGKKKPKALAY